MDLLERSNPLRWNNFRTLAGVLFLLSGLVLFLDRYLKTGWLSLSIIPLISLYLFGWGTRLRHPGLILSGAVLGGLGIGSAAALNPAVMPQPLFRQIGLFALFSGLGWLLMCITIALRTTRTAWWGMIPGGTLAGFGACLVFSMHGWADYILYTGVGLGGALMLWGAFDRLIGLVIAGCLVTCTTAGVALAWGSPGERSALVQTGIMLAWFALGWGLITVGGRLVLHRFLWWPLIPGGILAVVGWGLYIGGDPGNALGFIGNTGSIGLMIFGLYLLLMRKGIHHD